MHVSILMFEALTVMCNKFEDSILLEYDAASVCNQFVIFEGKLFSFKILGTDYPVMQCHPMETSNTPLRKPPNAHHIKIADL